jgi:hypothetical protein
VLLTLTLCCSTSQHKVRVKTAEIAEILAFCRFLQMHRALRVSTRLRRNLLCCSKGRYLYTFCRNLSFMQFLKKFYISAERVYLSTDLCRNCRRCKAPFATAHTPAAARLLRYSARRRLLTADLQAM